MYSAAAEDCDKEVGMVRERTQIPRSEAQLHGQARSVRVCEELVELIPTPCTEAGDDTAAFTKMGSEPREDLAACARREKRHHVSGAHDDVESLGNSE